MSNSIVRILLSCSVMSGLVASSTELRAETLFGAKTKKQFDENQVVLSLGVVSDVHICNYKSPTLKWKKTLEQLKAEAAKSDPDGIDGILIAGDLIDRPNDTWLGTLKRTYESVYDPKVTPLIYTVGNHDVPKYAWDKDMVEQAKYIRRGLGENYFLTDQDPKMGEEFECRDCLVGDYHVLCVSPISVTPITYEQKVLDWLDSRLAAITAAEPDKYVVIITHPMIAGTVYGSELGETDDEQSIWYSKHSGYWSTAALNPILEKYPQAVVFGGHLHFPLNDPRSVWQGKFTAMGCGSNRYMALENGHYEDMASQTVMKDADEFSQGYLVQFDANGNMRVFRMDFYHSAVIGGEPLQFQYPTKRGKNLKAYSHARRAAENKAPELSSAEVVIEDKTAALVFAAGTDDEFVHHYVITVDREEERVLSKKILSDFYKSALTSDMKKEWKIELGPAVPGDYEVTLEAFDSWGKSARKKIKVSL